MSDPSTASRSSLGGFAESFRRFFVRGLVAVLPTLITFWLVVWAWGFLWENAGKYILKGLSYLFWVVSRPTPFLPNFYLQTYLTSTLHLPFVVVQGIGVGLAILAIYFVGLVAGGFIGKTAYRVGETVVMRVPLVRAVYPAVKQVTDFVLSDRERTFVGSRVVAVKSHSSGIWSVGLYTGAVISGLGEKTGEEMVTVFIPSTPTAFTGYVVVAARKDVVDLPISVEEAMRLLVSGGVVGPGSGGGGNGAEVRNLVGETKL